MYQNGPLLAAFRLTDHTIAGRVSGGPASTAQSFLPEMGMILGLEEARTRFA